MTELRFHASLFLLLGLPRNCTERSRQQKAAAAPGNVRRVEARISAAHGLSSPSQFARFFQRKYGVYPSGLLRERRDILAG
jgi:AraC-like DNA-binding protein